MIGGDVDLSRDSARHLVQGAHRLRVEDPVRRLAGRRPQPLDQVQLRLFRPQGQHRVPQSDPLAKLPKPARAQALRELRLAREADLEDGVPSAREVRQEANGLEHRVGDEVRFVQDHHGAPHLLGELGRGDLEPPDAPKFRLTGAFRQPETAAELVGELALRRRGVVDVGHGGLLGELALDGADRGRLSRPHLARQQKEGVVLLPRMKKVLHRLPDLAAAVDDPRVRKRKERAPLHTEVARYISVSRSFALRLGGDSILITFLVLMRTRGLDLADDEIMSGAWRN